MLRRLTAAALSVAIPVAALCAPLVHAHLDGHDDHHDGSFVHAHFSPHTDNVPHGDQPRAGAHDDERTIWLQLFVGVAAASFAAPALPATSILLAAPVERGAHRPVDVGHAHDPPLRHALPSRAPPPFLA